MKRSEINAAIRWAETLLEGSCIRLPGFAYWDMKTWRANRGRIDTIRDVMQGWDVTDFGSGDFEHIGSVLFTARNGRPDAPGTGSPYCEKYLMIREDQYLPCHFHKVKTEDIINRGGAMLSMRFFNAREDGSVDPESDVVFLSDGVERRARAGEEILIERGDSVRITPRLYHIIQARDGDLIAGEVSSVNDDNTDNYFSEARPRFSGIVEDEAPLRPLCNEYDRL